MGQTIFGLSSALVLVAADGCEIRVDDWIALEEGSMDYEVNFEAISRAISEHQMKGGC